MGGEQEDEEDEELYGDLNLNLERRDAEMTDAHVNQEKEEVHVAFTTELPVVQQQSSFVSSDLVSKFMNPTSNTGIDLILNPNIQSDIPINVSVSVTTTTPSSDTTIPQTPIPIIQPQQQTHDSTTTTIIPATTLLNIPKFASLFGIVNNYLTSKMKDEVNVAIQLKSNKLKEEAQAENEEFLNQRSPNQPQTSYAVAASLSEFELKKILIYKIDENKSMNRSDVQKNLYNALIESYNSDKDLFASYGDVVTLKRGRDDQDKDENPPLDQTDGQKEGDQARKSKSAQAEKHGPRVDDLEKPSHQEFNTGNDDVSPAREINNLTQDVLTGPTYDLMKGTCKSVVELEYHLEEVFKATHDQLDLHNPKGRSYPHDLSKPLPLIQNARGRQVIPFDHFINNDLEYLKGGSLSQRYTTLITKTKAAEYGHVKWIKDKVPRNIEDMLLLLVQGKLTNLNLDERFALNVALRISLKMTPYTAYPDIQGIIYQDDMDGNRLMRTDELHKFSDGTLNHVRTALNDIATGIQMEYLSKRKWTKQDKQRTWVMINSIDKKLKDRRLMRSLEKFVGGRPYRGDLRLLQKTI
ncbi:hypothetical protein Tco_0422237 [Tanacetum coccineum]